MSMTYDLGVLAIGFVKEAIDNSVSLDDMSAGLTETSNQIFGDRPSPLLDFVNKYLPDIIHYLDKGLTPGEVCEALALG